MAAVTGNRERTEKHPNSLANLRKFEPGKSGNPAGRPKTPLTDEIRRLLGRKIKGTTISYVRAIAEGLAREAIKGDAASTKIILERTEGKVIQPLDVNGQIQVVIDL